MWKEKQQTHFPEPQKDKHQTDANKFLTFLLLKKDKKFNLA